MLLKTLQRAFYLWSKLWHVSSIFGFCYSKFLFHKVKNKGWLTFHLCYHKCKVCTAVNFYGQWNDNKMYLCLANHAMEARKGVVLLTLLIWMGEAFGEKVKRRTRRPWEKACKGDKPKIRGACGITCASATGEWLTMACSTLSTISRTGCEGCNETMHCFHINVDGKQADCRRGNGIITVGQHNARELGIPPKYDPYLKECVPEEWTCPDQVGKVF